MFFTISLPSLESIVNEFVTKRVNSLSFKLIDCGSFSSTIKYNVFMFLLTLGPLGIIILFYTIRAIILLSSLILNTSISTDFLYYTYILSDLFNNHDAEAITREDSMDLSNPMDIWNYLNSPSGSSSSSSGGGSPSPSPNPGGGGDTGLLVTAGAANESSQQTLGERNTRDSPNHSLTNGNLTPPVDSSTRYRGPILFHPPLMQLPSLPPLPDTSNDPSILPVPSSRTGLTPSDPSLHVPPVHNRYDNYEYDSTRPLAPFREGDYFWVHQPQMFLDEADREMDRIEEKIESGYTNRVRLEFNYTYVNTNKYLNAAQDGMRQHSSRYSPGDIELFEYRMNEVTERFNLYIDGMNYQNRATDTIREAFRNARRG